MKTIFGPVPSRRLGFSLGVDVIPYKTCSFDCIYCELGKTTCKTVEPVATVSPETVLKELTEVLASSPLTIDTITLSGSGEPTLHPQLDLIIKEIKKIASIPVALITNGSLLFKDEILQKVLAADVIIPSLDAPDEAVFQTVNRPDPSLTFDQLVEGLINLGKSRGPRKIWLEVLLLRGLNDAPGQIEKLYQTIEKINPEKIQLNTVVRPPVEGYAAPLDYSQLKEVQRVLGPRAEIIVSSTRENAQPTGSLITSEIRAMVARRPCTAEDIAQCLGLSLEKTIHFLNELIQAKRVTYELFNQQGFYRGI